MGLVVVLASCGVFSSDDPTTTEGSSGGTPDQNAKPPGVDGAPLEGVFVSFSKGNDATGDGSQEKPLGSIGAGLRKGQTERKRVLVCAETYAEQVTLIDGVSMYGYFDCSGAPWKLDETKRAKIAPTKSPTVRAENLKEPTRLEGFEIVGPELGPGSETEREAFQNASIALYVKSSGSLSVGKSILRGGRGRDGVDAPAPPNPTSTVLATPQNGRDETQCSLNPPGVVCSGAGRTGLPGGTGGQLDCGGGRKGNAGGNGGLGCHMSSSTTCYLLNPGTAGDAIPATAAVGEGGAVAQYRYMGADAKAGADGAPGNDGASGGQSFTDQGPVPGDGSVGLEGKFGQAGGGSGGYARGVGGFDGNLAASGAGGGGGGCPGLPAARGGLGGGASVGLYLVASTVRLEKATVAGGTGGRAGAGIIGSPGSSGQQGGKGGFVNNSQTRCNNDVLNEVCHSGAGGTGGKGGRGGASGHGASGASFAVVQVGASELKQDADTKLEAGKGGAGAPAIAGTTVTAMPDGLTDTIFKQP